MGNTVLKVENLSKQYRLGLVGTQTLSDDLKRWWYKARGKEDPFLKIGEENIRSEESHSDYIWAIKDINFEIEEGEVLGIIGKNGAGKSTLLKILSRVTGPTTGQIKAKGRIASLLEVGTGFHPELTGKENIFLNGAILGMTKSEIKRKFDEIIDFAGVIKYVDTPVKRYSSGMKVRLGFSIAAYLEPEILVVDEVLAVGDADFQKKAIGKMQDVSQGEGRTVLFVSHNMASVKSLCSRAMILKNGLVEKMGGVDNCVNHYLRIGETEGMAEYKEFKGEDRISERYFDLLSIGIRAVNKNYGDFMRMDENLELNIVFNKKDSQSQIDTTIQVKDRNGNYILASASGGKGQGSNKNEGGLISNSVYLPANFFNSGQFYCDLLFVENRKNVLLRLNDILMWKILSKKQELGAFMGHGKAPLKPDFRWESKIEKQ